MVNIVGSTDDFKRWKPKGMEDFLTISEVCRVVKRDVSWIRRMEYKDKSPVKPVRVKVGRLSVRLYSPADVAALKTLFAEREADRKKRKKKSQKRG